MYSTIDWTDLTDASKSKVDASKSQEIGEEDKKKQEDEKAMTPYMHKAFIEKYIEPEDKK